MGKHCLVRVLVLLAILLSGCKSGKKVHLVDYSPYVEPKTGAVKAEEDTFWDCFWEFFYPSQRQEPREEPTKIRLDRLEVSWFNGKWKIAGGLAALERHPARKIAASCGEGLSHMGKIGKWV